MSKELAIKGDKERGNEVIALLEMLGGDNRWKASGNIEKVYYSISNGVILYGTQLEKSAVGFTLDEFYKKYPFKVGDRVLIPEYESEVCINQMIWDGWDVEYMVYRNDDEEWYTATELKNWNDDFYDMGTKVEGSLTISEDMINTSRLEIDLNEYEYNIENNKLIIQKKKLLYPKTYRECFYTLYGHKNDAFNLSGVTDEEYDLFGNLIKLKRCRDAYWKIAGEEMGLGKTWKPDWMDKTTKYGICAYQNTIIKDNVIRTNRTLVFPTPEMQDVFYKNFKDLIEQCKELL